MSSRAPSGSASRRLLAVILGSVVSFTLFAAYMVVPPAGLFSGLLAPFPAAVCFFRFGRATAFTITLGATALLAAVFGPSAAALYLSQCGMIGVMLPELLSREHGSARSITWTSSANLLLFAMAAGVVSVVTGQNPHQMAVKEINDSIGHAVMIYEKAGIKGDELDQVKQSMAMAGQLISRIYPALITIILIAMCGINVALLKRAAVRWHFGFKTSEFRDFRTPHQLVWLLIIAGFAMLAGLPIITVPALNVLVVLGVIYFLQGMAVSTAIIARQAFAGILRIALFLMLMFQPYLCALIAMVGLFDLWGDFRTPKNKENL